MKKSIQRLIEIEFGGIAVLPFLLMAGMSFSFLLSGNLQQTGIVGAFATMWSIGFILYAIGEKLPIWRQYMGGGLILAFLGSASLVHFGWINQDDSQFMFGSVIDNRFLYFLLVGLVGGTILSINRRDLVQSVLGLIPVIVFAISGAMIFGVIAGLVFDIRPGRIITHYVLPVMSGGNGAGAIPMSEIYADSTGEDNAIYYGFAISILTMSNLVAILLASLLNMFGKKFPSLTGNGKLKKEIANNFTVEEKSISQNPSSPLNTQNAIFFIISMLLFSMSLYGIFPQIHLFAWAVALFVVLNLLDILPSSLTHALKTVNEWGLKTFLILVLVSVGLMTDLGVLIESFTLANIAIASCVVMGAASGAAIGGLMFKFYPIEAAIAAGLCMTNRGGSGDIEVLSAANRMNLFPYAQLSSRLGGGLVLFLAGYLFSILLS